MIQHFHFPAGNSDTKRAWLNKILQQRYGASYKVLYNKDYSLIFQCDNISDKPIYIYWSSWFYLYTTNWNEETQQHTGDYLFGKAYLSGDEASYELFLGEKIMLMSCQYTDGNRAMFIIGKTKNNRTICWGNHSHPEHKLANKIYDPVNNLLLDVIDLNRGFSDEQHNYFYTDLYFATDGISSNGQILTLPDGSPDCFEELFLSTYEVLNDYTSVINESSFLSLRRLYCNNKIVLKTGLYLTYEEGIVNE